MVSSVVSGTLFLNPEINAYWRDILDGWKTREPDLQVRVGTLTGAVPWADWIQLLGPGRRHARPMYYGGWSQRHPTPIWQLLLELLRLRPEHIVCYGFSGWTLLACIWRTLGLCRRLSLLWEGSTPGVNLAGDRNRQRVRAWALGRAEQAITQSPAGQDYLQSLGTPTPIFRRPWLAANPYLFVPAAVAESQCTRFVYVGSLEERKGTDFLLEVFADLPGDWQLDLVGPWLMSASRPSHPRICLRGQCSAQEVQQLLSQGQVFVFPSREETWGVAPIEAACAGLAVVTSEHTPSGGLRPDWLRLPLQVEPWKQALQGFMTQPQRAARLGAANRSTEERLYAQLELPWRTPN
ncbi:glycosyltransferase family 4 protein [bacterium]|nr:glycosyltransferase family 4 protein [bacterium]